MLCRAAALAVYAAPYLHAYALSSTTVTTPGEGTLVSIADTEFWGSFPVCLANGAPDALERNPVSDGAKVCPTTINGATACMKLSGEDPVHGLPHYEYHLDTCNENDDREARDVYTVKMRARSLSSDEASSLELGRDGLMVQEIPVDLNRFVDAAIESMTAISATATVSNANGDSVVLGPIVSLPERELPEGMRESIAKPLLNEMLLVPNVHEAARETVIDPGAYMQVDSSNSVRERLPLQTWMQELIAEAAGKIWDATYFPESSTATSTASIPTTHTETKEQYTARALKQWRLQVHAMGARMLAAPCPGCDEATAAADGFAVVPATGGASGILHTDRLESCDSASEVTAASFNLWMPVRSAVESHDLGFVSKGSPQDPSQDSGEDKLMRSAEMHALQDQAFAAKRILRIALVDAKDQDAKMRRADCTVQATLVQSFAAPGKSTEESDECSSRSIIEDFATASPAVQKLLRDVASHSENFQQLDSGRGSAGDDETLIRSWIAAALGDHFDANGMQFVYVPSLARPKDLTAQSEVEKPRMLMFLAGRSPRAVAHTARRAPTVNESTTAQKKIQRRSIVVNSCLQLPRPWRLEAPMAALHMFTEIDAVQERLREMLHPCLVDDSTDGARRLTGFTPGNKATGCNHLSKAAAALRRATEELTKGARKSALAHASWVQVDTSGKQTPVYSKEAATVRVFRTRITEAAKADRPLLEPVIGTGSALHKAVTQVLLVHDLNLPRQLPWPCADSEAKKDAEVRIHSNNELALFGGTPVVKRETLADSNALSARWPAIDTAYFMQLVEEVVVSGAYDSKSAAGTKMIQLESGFARYIGGESIGGEFHALMTSSGTSALLLALAAADVQPGDEVLVPAFSWISTALCVVTWGATPVFVDVDETANIDITKLAAAQTPKTKAVIVVHLHGNPIDMQRLHDEAVRLNLLVIEDAAQAHGAMWRGNIIGAAKGPGIAQKNLPTLAAFSLQQSKNLPAGNGGIFLTDSELHRRRALAARSHGLKMSNETVDGVNLNQSHARGSHFRGNELAAALALPFLESLEERVATANKHFKVLSGAVGSLHASGLRLVGAVSAEEECWGTRASLHKVRLHWNLTEAGLGRYIVPRLYQKSRSTDPTGGNGIVRKMHDGSVASFGACFRKTVKDALNAEGVDAVYWELVPLPRHPVFAKYGKAENIRRSYPMTEDLQDNSVVLFHESRPMLAQTAKGVQAMATAVTKVWAKREEIAGKCCSRLGLSRVLSEPTQLVSGREQRPLQRAPPYFDAAARVEEVERERLY